MMRSAVLLCLVCAISATTVSIFPLEAVQDSFYTNANKTCAARNEISFEAEWTQTCTSETTVNNTVEECIEPKQPLVLYFLLDSSDSVQRSEWKSGLLWVNHIVTSTYQRQQVMALQDKIGVVIIQVSDDTRIEWANYYDTNTMDDFNKMLAYLAVEKFDMGSNVFHGFETAKSLVRNATNVAEMRVHAIGMGERVHVSNQAGFAAFDNKMELKQYSYDPIKIADEGMLQQIYQHENGQTATCKAATEWLRPDGNSPDCVFDVAANTFSDANPNCANIVFSGTKEAQTVLYIVTDGDVIDDTDVDSAEVFDYRTTIVHGCDKNGRDRSIDALMALRQTSMVMYMCSASKRDVKISELDDQLKKQNRVMDSTKKVCAVDIVVMYENLNCCCNKEEDAVQKFAKAKRQLKVAMERFIKADKDYQYEFNIALISFNENVTVHKNFKSTRSSTVNSIFNNFEAEMEKKTFGNRAPAIRKAIELFENNDAKRYDLAENEKAMPYRCVEQPLKVEGSTTNIADFRKNPRKKTRVCALRQILVVTDEGTWNKDWDNEEEQNSLADLRDVARELKQARTSVTSVSIFENSVIGMNGQAYKQTFSVMLETSGRIPSLLSGQTSQSNDIMVIGSAPGSIGKGMSKLLKCAKPVDPLPRYDKTTCEAVKMKSESFTTIAPRGPCGIMGEAGDHGKVGRAGPPGPPNECCVDSTPYYHSTCNDDSDCAAKPCPMTDSANNSTSILGGKCVDSRNGGKQCTYCWDQKKASPEIFSPRTCTPEGGEETYICCMGACGDNGQMGERGDPGAAGKEGQKGDAGDKGPKGKQGAMPPVVTEEPDTKGEFERNIWMMFQVQLLMSRCACKSSDCQPHGWKKDLWMLDFGADGLPFGTDEPTPAAPAAPATNKMTPQNNPSDTKIVRNVPVVDKPGDNPTETPTADPVVQPELFDCLCDDGTSAGKVCAKRSHIKCASCDQFYHLTNERETYRCERNICKCNNGDAAGNCAEHGSEQCQACYKGYSETGSKKITCEKNICACDNGKASEGAECETSGEKKCASCNTGFDISGNECIQRTCKCDNGTPGTDCTVKDGASCATCHANYKKSGNTCEPKTCKCDNGLPVGNGDCDNELDQRCQSVGCNGGYKYNAGTKSCDLVTISDYCEVEVPDKKVFVYFAIDVAEKETRMQSMLCTEELVGTLPLDFVPVLHVFPTTRNMYSSSEAITEMYDNRNQARSIKEVRRLNMDLTNNPESIKKKDYYTMWSAKTFITRYSAKVTNYYKKYGQYNDILLTITPGKIHDSEYINGAYKQIPMDGHLLFGANTSITRQLISRPKKSIIEHDFATSDSCDGEAQKVKEAVCGILKRLAKKDDDEDEANERNASDGGGARKKRNALKHKRRENQIRAARSKKKSGGFMDELDFLDFGFPETDTREKMIMDEY